MRRKNVDIEKDEAENRIRKFMKILDQAGVVLTLDQQLFILQKLKADADGNGKGGDG